MLLDDSAGSIVREIGGRIRIFPLPILFHHGFPCSYITWGMNIAPLRQQFKDIVSHHWHVHHHHHHHQFPNFSLYSLLLKLSLLENRHSMCYSCISTLISPVSKCLMFRQKSSIYIYVCLGQLHR
jgi:hypothetical protein